MSEIVGPKRNPNLYQFIIELYGKRYVWNIYSFHASEAAKSFAEMSVEVNDALRRMTEKYPPNAIRPE